jgi:hypothetical protein
MRTLLIVVALVAGAIAQVEFDTKIIPAHVEYVRDTAGVVTDSVQVPETIYREQVRAELTEPLASGDTLELMARRRSDGKVIGYKLVVIRPETYPKNGNVLRVLNYTLFLESKR